MQHIELNNAWILLIVHSVLAAASAGHALLYKKDPGAALGWIGFTGGMNIGDRHLRNRSDSSKWTADIHFQLTDRSSASYSRYSMRTGVSPPVKQARNTSNISKVYQQKKP